MDLLLEIDLDLRLSLDLDLFLSLDFARFLSEDLLLPLLGGVPLEWDLRLSLDLDLFLSLDLDFDFRLDLDLDFLDVFSWDLDRLLPEVLFLSLGGDLLFTTCLTAGLSLETDLRFSLDLAGLPSLELDRLLAPLPSNLEPGDLPSLPTFFPFLDCDSIDSAELALVLLDSFFLDLTFLAVLCELDDPLESESESELELELWPTVV